MKRLGYSCYGLALTGSLAGSLLAAGMAFGAAAKKPLFTVSSEPPPGFKQLAKPQKILIDVYLGGRYLGVFNATVAPNYVVFANPKKLVAKLTGIKNAKRVIHALSGKLLPHSNLVCHQYTHAICRNLKPKVAGIIYNPGNFRAYVFVNPYYLKRPSVHHRELPDSTAGLSYLNRIYMVSSNSSLDNEHDYSLTTSNTFGYEDAHINVIASYANDLTDGGNAELREANFELTHHRYRYSFGLLDTLGNTFLANQTILGAQFETTLDTLPDIQSDLGTPLNIFLNFPSQVSIYKDGELIYTERYPSGNQHIDTRSFPEGAYPIVIKIMNSQGGTREENRFFVKTNDLAPIGLPQYYASVGELTGFDRYNAGSTLTLASTPIAQAGVRLRLGDRWGWSASALASDEVGYFNTGIAFFDQHWEIKPSALVGTDGSVGYSIYTSLEFDRFFFNGSLTELWHGNEQEFNQLVRQRDFSRLLSLNTLQASVSANCRIASNTSIGFNATVNESEVQRTTYSYGPSFRTVLFHLGRAPVNLDIEANDSQDGYTVLAGLSVNFSVDDWALSAAGGYNWQGDTTSFANDSGGTGSASAYYNNRDQTDNGFSVGMNANIDPEVQSAGAVYQYQNNRLHLSTYGNYNHSDRNDGFAQYGGTLSTHIAWTPEATTVGAGRTSANTGLIVDVDTAQVPGKFDVYVGNRLVKHVEANDSALVLLPPFHTYKIHLVDRSQHLFQVKDVEQVVTLYPGNVQYLQWQAVQTHIVIGHFENAAGESVAHAMLQGGIGYAVSDNLGYFQLRVGNRQRYIDATLAGQHCRVKLPASVYQQEYVYLGDVHCS